MTLRRSVIAFLLPGLAAGLFAASLPASLPALPLAPERKVEFATEEGTWISLDVSPSGEAIVFELAGDLYTIPARGGEATPISTGMGFDAQPRYSPNGEWIAFVSDRDGAENLWIAKSDGTGARALTKDQQSSFASPEWTEDGTSVIASRNAPGLRTYELWLYDTRGGSGIQITKGKPRAETLPADQHNALGAVASNDGRYFYYATKKGGFAYNVTFPLWQIARRDRRTGDEDILTQAPGSAFRPALSPDNRWLVYGARYDAQTGLRIRDLRSGEDRWLAYPVQRDDQESRFTRDLLPGYSFTPDGRAVIVSYGGKLHRVDVATGSSTPIPFRAKVALDLGPRLDFPARVEDGAVVRARLIQGAALSPDGTTLAFSAFGRIYVAPATGGTPRRLTAVAAAVDMRRDAWEFTPTFSRDSRTIYFVTWSSPQGGHIMSAPLASGAPIRITSSPAFYRDPVVSPDGSRLIALRAPSASRVEIESEWGGTEPAGLELVSVPASGGEAASIVPARNFGKPHFGPESDRVYVTTRDGLVSLRFDGTDRRTHLKVVGKTPAPDPAPASDIRIAPDGKHVLAAVSTQLFAFPAPPASGDTPTINVSAPAVPVVRLTDVGVDEIVFSGDGASLGWTLGSTLFTRAISSLRFGEEPVPANPAAPASPPTPAEARRAESDATAVSFVVEHPRARASGTLVFRGARAITMSDARGGVIENADVVIEGNRILSVGPSGSVSIPEGARLIDATDKTLMPGLIDVHAHWTEVRRRVLDRAAWPFAANLAYGVTSGRDPQTATNDVFAYQDLIDAGLVKGSRAFNTGPGVFSNTDFQNAAAAKSVVAKYREHYRTNTLKSYTVGNRKQRQWMVMASKEHQIMPTTEGALDLRLNFTHAIDGFAGTEHSLPIVPLFQDVIEVFARSGITYTPTLLVAYGGPWAENHFYESTEVWKDAKLRRFIPTNVLELKAKRRPWFAEDEHVFRKLAAEAAKIARAGGRVAVGGHGQLQGIQCHWEMWAFVAGGMTPLEALRAGTISGAEAIGFAQDLGTIEAGKLADIVVLDKNPLDDIRHSTAIRMVMKDGELFDGETLDVLWPGKEPRQKQWWWDAGPPSAPVGGLAESEVYLANISGSGAALRIAPLRNISNHPGYDNQPRFEADGRGLVFTQAAENGRTDIMRYDVPSGRTSAVRMTPESEFSALPMADGRGYGVIRVELDGTQRLWRMSATDAARASGGSGVDELMVATVRPIGYFAFPEPGFVAAFVLGSPPTLQLIDLKTEEARLVASNPGRSLHKIPGRPSVSFLHKLSPDEWSIKELDARGNLKTLARAPKGREDYTWLPDGTLLISAGTKILSMRPGLDADWREVVDVTSFGISEISRLATSLRGDRIAVVGVPASAPPR